MGDSETATLTTGVAAERCPMTERKRTMPPARARLRTVEPYSGSRALTGAFVFIEISVSESLLNEKNSSGPLLVNGIHQPEGLLVRQDCLFHLVHHVGEAELVRRVGIGVT